MKIRGVCETSRAPYIRHGKVGGAGEPRRVQFSDARLNHRPWGHFLDDQPWISSRQPNN